MYANVRTVSLQGATGHVIEVQVDVSQGMIATALVGRPDASINEARDRCRSAIQNSGHTWPVTRRITILLSPADLPKRGPHFDLAIAVGVLAADNDKELREKLDGAVLKDCLDGAVLIGELTLDGRVRCVPGVLPMTMAAANRGLTCVYVPEPQAAEAAMVPGMSVYGVRSLSQVLALLTGASDIPDAPEVEPLTGDPLLSWRGEERLEDLDMSDVRGMTETRFALEVAAAGGHHILLNGPKGAGKTTLAERLPTILPDLWPDESLELTAIHSLSGGLRPGESRLTRPPFKAPHHSASRAGVLGGGSGRVRPGDVSKAHLGVLFLDEFPLFPSDVLEALREPLESGEITISRGDETAVYPARSLVVMACNPCPCGEFHPQRPDNGCTCGEVRRRTYRNRISGPIADRIDITRFVEPLREHEHDPRFDPTPESSLDIRARVTLARKRQAMRYADAGWRLNAHAPGPALRERWPLAEVAARRIDVELMSGRLTQRGAVRVHRLAWSVADVLGLELPGYDELDIALRLRSAQPLELRCLPLSGGAA